MMNSSSGRQAPSTGHHMPPDPNFTAARGRVRDHGQAAKSLLYGSDNIMDVSSDKRLGKKVTEAAVLDVIECKDAPKGYVKKEEKLIQAKVGADHFDADVYLQNRAFNQANKQESLRKAYSGSGALW